MSALRLNFRRESSSAVGSFACICINEYVAGFAHSNIYSNPLTLECSNQPVPKSPETFQENLHIELIN